MLEREVVNWHVRYEVTCLWAGRFKGGSPAVVSMAPEGKVLLVLEILFKIFDVELIYLFSMIPLPIMVLVYFVIS